MHFHYMTDMAMPLHMNACPGDHENYNFGRPFLGHHHYLFNLPDLGLGMKHFLYSTEMAMP